MLLGWHYRGGRTRLRSAVHTVAVRNTLGLESSSRAVHTSQFVKVSYFQRFSPPTNAFSDLSLLSPMTTSRASASNLNLTLEACNDSYQAGDSFCMMPPCSRNLTDNTLFRPWEAVCLPAQPGRRQECRLQLLAPLHR